ncbi:MAG: Ferredoxin [Candidatus Methanohalarchaeum thermophilum]|uniref:Ferredoxin n=1 Tax=Methanohalarchaeum thermophilum TaxID=1903181 RepID=A0A1Q6DSH8_METT1|nr:MAG: Ferredoxin [Candidatus Methanohalarchaeum thermophilum]
MKRDIIEIDQEKCTGCGQCVKGCPEGAIQIIDGKAYLVNENYCDGLGACIGECPEDAITIEHKEAEPYNEKEVVDNMLKKGKNKEVLKAHLEHLKEHKQRKLLKTAIKHLQEKNIEPPIKPKGIMKELKTTNNQKQDQNRTQKQKQPQKDIKNKSQLQNWPIQLELAPTTAQYYENADLLIAADCVPFAYNNFHEDLIKNKTTIIGCPKLDDKQNIKQKLQEIIQKNKINSITIAHMEVPCCQNLTNLIKQAIKETDKQIPLKEKTITVEGKIK